ncbi:DUF1818 family protein [Pseudanabaena sp. PCC 6802]|uniref:DUF1818 family protein n=1 Tax=Pseudanabaena sp. PCC 6802 TaxID=118173 RepID=UPI00034A63D6|nr:DUF1818 family protein [Pseudanabaena sp. PCC 6802]
MSKQLYSGRGWRIGWLPSAYPFQGLVGGDNWAFELTHRELREFCQIGIQLIESMQAMQIELSETESLTCTAETETIWLEASGYPDDFKLSFQIRTGRRGEGMWEYDALMEMTSAITAIALEMPQD